MFKFRLTFENKRKGVESEMLSITEMNVANVYSNWYLRITIIKISRILICVFAEKFSCLSKHVKHLGGILVKLYV